MLSKTDACPGLFYATPTQDGILSRIRIPGGILTVPQCEAIADLASRYGAIQITNRANLQIRSAEALPIATLTYLQEIGLAAAQGTDHLRNIMASPTAGIDAQALIDTRSWVAQWDEYLTQHPALSPLSAKFSVCFEGGEAVSVRDRPNDISLVAARLEEAIYFRLHLSRGDRGEPPQDVGILLKPEESLLMLAALATLYLDYTMQQIGSFSQGSVSQGSVSQGSVSQGSVSQGSVSQRGDRHVRSLKPRFRTLLDDWGINAVLQSVQHHLPFPLRREFVKQPSSTLLYRHLGIHPQAQPELSYIGVALPLGRLQANQLRGLGALAVQQGNGTLRLTPWQNLILPDIPHSQIATVQQSLEHLGLPVSTIHPWGAIVACAGSKGCKFSATDTQSHALALAEYLEQQLNLDRPINIHFSGCEKSCAQHHSGDMTLMGVAGENYDLYIGSATTENQNSVWGQELYRECSIEQSLNLIEQILRIYQDQQSDANETLIQFIDRISLDRLKQLLGNSQQLWESPPNLHQATGTSLTPPPDEVLDELGRALFLSGTLRERIAERIAGRKANG